MIGIILLAVFVAGVAYVLFSDRFAGFRTKTAAWLTAILGGALPLAGDASQTFLPYAYDVSAYLKDLDWRQYLDASRAPYIMIGLGVLFYILRRMVKAT